MKIFRLGLAVLGKKQREKNATKRIVYYAPRGEKGDWTNFLFPVVDFYNMRDFRCFSLQSVRRLKGVVRLIRAKKKHIFYNFF